MWIKALITICTILFCTFGLASVLDLSPSGALTACTSVMTEIPFVAH